MYVQGRCNYKRNKKKERPMYVPPSRPLPPEETPRCPLIDPPIQVTYNPPFPPRPWEIKK